MNSDLAVWLTRYFNLHWHICSSEEADGASSVQLAALEFTASVTEHPLEWILVLMSVPPFHLIPLLRYLVD
jgi:hypothetical protein